MRLIQSIALAMAFTATGTTAAPDAATEIEPGLFEQVFDAGELVVDSSISIGDASVAGLAKRKHEQCWDNHLTTRQNQEAYEEDCDNLIFTLQNSPRTQLLQAGQAVQYSTPSQRCKVIIRNQSSCTVKIVVNKWAGDNAKTTLNECISLTQCSGWGYISNDQKLTYIVEPFQVAPPTYSPTC
ncbi:hypothetical protein NQ176_g1266 [Zarea fungicola]|uniref:Uncharacterized protein n=1 Tax=Zarea fungicola TaxID=93591 RepID=A0ACC1NV13_9HYPO|nr:hypothetical protein NQ176_g1266 [Lecanicillium fungicola]